MPAHANVYEITGPCDGCRFAPRCAVELLACERFSGFLHGSAESRWRAFPCAPSRARYYALLVGELKMGRPPRPADHTFRGQYREGPNRLGSGLLDDLRTNVLVRGS